MTKIREKATMRCAFCDGTGHDRFGILSPPSACQVCLGRGVVEVPEPRVPCAYCRGRGIQPHTRLTCSSCRGRGAQTVREPYRTCPRCGGSGVDTASERKLSCSDCRGAGVVHIPHGPGAFPAHENPETRRQRPEG